MVTNSEPTAWHISPNPFCYVARALLLIETNLHACSPACEPLKALYLLREKDKLFRIDVFHTWSSQPPHHHLHSQPLFQELGIFQGLHVYPCVILHFEWKKNLSFHWSLLVEYLFLEMSCPSLKIQLKYFLLLGILKALLLNLLPSHNLANIWVNTY